MDFSPVRGYICIVTAERLLIFFIRLVLFKSYLFELLLYTLRESTHNCCNWLLERVEGKMKMLAGICTTLALAVPQPTCPSVPVTWIVPLQQNTFQPELPHLPFCPTPQSLAQCPPCAPSL